MKEQDAGKSQDSRMRAKGGAGGCTNPVLRFGDVEHCVAILQSFRCRAGWYFEEAEVVLKVQEVSDISHTLLGREDAAAPVQDI